MATTVISTIGTGGTYNDLASWVAARKGDLVTRDTVEVAELLPQTHNMTTIMNLVKTENTVDSTHYFHVRPHSSANWFSGDFNNIDGVPVLTASNINSTSFVLIGSYVSYTRIEGFIVKDLSNLTGSVSAIVVGNGQNIGSLVNRIGVQNLYSQGPSSGASSIGIYNYHQGGIVSNCVVNNIRSVYVGASVNKSESAIGIQGTATDTGSSCYNCTVANLYCDSGAGSNSNSYGIYNFLVSRNNIAGKLDATGRMHIEIFAYNVNATQSNNISDDTTAAGDNSHTSIDIATEITNASTTAFNAHLLATSTYAKEGGIDLSSIFTGDVDGQTRGAIWDIGADQITFPLIASSKMNVARYSQQQLSRFLNYNNAVFSAKGKA